MLEIRAVQKTLARRPVLRGVDLTCQGATIVALLGANGSGKSTLLRVVTGVFAPDAGAVHLRGEDVHQRPAARRALGYVPEDGRPLGFLTVRELLALTAAMKRCEPLPEPIAERLGLPPLLGQSIDSLSLGQRRRAALGVALVGDPWLLVLDEPTNGLSDDGVEVLANLLREHADRGGAVLLATHDLPFAERLAHRHVRLTDGRIAG